MKNCGNCYWWSRDYGTNSGTCEKTRYSSNSYTDALCTQSFYVCDNWEVAGDGAIYRRWIDRPGKYK